MPTWCVCLARLCMAVAAARALWPGRLVRCCRKLIMHLALHRCHALHVPLAGCPDVGRVRPGRRHPRNHPGEPAAAGPGAAARNRRPCPGGLLSAGDLVLVRRLGDGATSWTSHMHMWQPCVTVQGRVALQAGSAHSASTRAAAQAPYRPRHLAPGSGALQGQGL